MATRRLIFEHIPKSLSAISQAHALRLPLTPLIAQTRQITSQQATQTQPRAQARRQEQSSSLLRRPNQQAHQQAPPHHHHRSYSTAPAPPTPKAYDYPSIKSLTESPTPSRVLIDVREPAEYAEGYIPTAINLPIKSAPEALLLPADEFEDRFGFAKPPADAEVVFYCRSGVRSSAAARLAGEAGYKSIGEYRGSWLDWAAQGGKVGR